MTRKLCNHLKVSFVIQATDYLYCTNIPLTFTLQMALLRSSMSSIASSLKFKMHWFPKEKRYQGEKLQGRSQVGSWGAREPPL